MKKIRFRLPAVKTVANLSENELSNPEKNSNYTTLKKYAEERNIELIPFSAKIEADLQYLDETQQIIRIHGAALAEFEKMYSTDFVSLNVIYDR